MSDVEPIVVERRLDAPTAESVIAIPVELRYLRGHFPGHPVVPGVVQIKWALEEAARQLGTGMHVRALEAVKFNRIISPGEQVTLSLRFDDKSNKLHFLYASVAGTYSSGRILLQDAA